LSMGKGLHGYFTFLPSVRLPTNYRVNYAEKTGYDLQKCKFCLMNMIDDMNHLFVCPALLLEQKNFYNAVEEKLREWQIPYVNKNIQSLENRTCQRWFSQAKHAFLGPNGRNGLSPEKLWTMTKDFWNANSLKHDLNLNTLMSNLRAVLERPFTCPIHAQCSLPCGIVLPQDLLSILVRRLHLCVEGSTTVLHKSPLFAEWCSSDKYDLRFGSKGSSREYDFTGSNSLLFFNKSIDEKTRKRMIAKVREWVTSKKPTRILLITPSQDVQSILRPTDRCLLEIARSQSDFPVLHCSINNVTSPLLGTAMPMSIVLALNKESMILDPMTGLLSKMISSNGRTPNVQI
jgi:hypothetical protein